jgi:hypothetical protein
MPAPQRTADTTRSVQLFAAVDDGACPPNAASSHPALIALACLLGRAVAHEVFKKMSQAAAAGSGSTRH